MPLYDFKCADEHITTVNVGMSEVRPTVDCAHCQQTALRVFSAPMVPVLDGWNAKFGRKRRPNPGDDIKRDHDPAAHAMYGRV